MLALDAVIKAARAGDYWKGFTIVASEVRTLAERSQKVVGDIGKKLAGSSVTMIELAGNLLGEMVPSINKTADLVILNHLATIKNLINLSLLIFEHGTNNVRTKY